MNGKADPRTAGERDHLEGAAGPGARSARARAGAGAHRARRPGRAYSPNSASPGRRPAWWPPSWRRWALIRGGRPARLGGFSAPRTGPRPAGGRRGRSRRPSRRRSTPTASGVAGPPGGRIAATAPGREISRCRPGEGASARWSRRARNYGAPPAGACRRLTSPSPPRSLEPAGLASSTPCTWPGRSARFRPGDLRGVCAPPASADPRSPATTPTCARRTPVRRRPGARGTCCGRAIGHRGVGGALVLDGRPHTGSLVSRWR